MLAPTWGQHWASIGPGDYPLELSRSDGHLGPVRKRAIPADLTGAAIELKVLIEQMREQVQNVE